MTLTKPSAPTEKQAGLDQEPEIPVTSQAVVIDEFADESQQDPPFTTAIPVGLSEPSTKYSSTATTSTSLGRTVEVIAPTNLLGGYQFYVDVGNNASLKVEVPPGGVQQGQRFQARVVEEVPSFSDPHHIPTGHWRDDLCDCCRFGCCHPQCCLTFWCPACALGQVLTRLKLDWCANPQRSSTAMNTFTLFVIITAVYIIVSNVLGTAVRVGEDEKEKDENGEYEDVDWVDAVSIVRFMVEIAFALFLLVVTIRTRGYIRNKYNIPEKHCCDGCEDFCCSFWCTMCTICQMARHTADYQTYSAGCCTEDGLSRGAPHVV